MVVQLASQNMWNSQFPLDGLQCGFVRSAIIKRESARIKCELGGHCHAELKRKYDDQAYCPRCTDAITTRAPSSDSLSPEKRLEAHDDERNARVLVPNIRQRTWVNDGLRPPFPVTEFFSQTTGAAIDEMLTNGTIRPGYLSVATIKKTSSGGQDSDVTRG